MRQSRLLPAVLWPVGIAAVVTGLVPLFEGDTDVTWVAVINRGVGGIDARPREYEQRVVGFFDEALAIDRRELAD